jgi:hypothetical protein
MALHSPWLAASFVQMSLSDRAHQLTLIRTVAATLSDLAATLSDDF